MVHGCFKAINYFIPRLKVYLLLILLLFSYVTNATDDHVDIDGQRYDGENNEDDLYEGDIILMPKQLSEVSYYSK